MPDGAHSQFAIGFYRRVGADIMDDWRMCRLSADGIDKLAAGG